MQINSKIFNAIKNEYSTLTQSDLINHPCLNIHIGAMILSRNFSIYGKHWLLACINDIDHTKTKARSPHNGIGERFHETVLQEFYQVTFRKKCYGNLHKFRTDK